MTGSGTHDEKSDSAERIAELKTATLASDDLELLKLEAEQTLSVARTQKVIAETRLLEVKARWQPVVVLTYLVWGVAMIGLAAALSTL